MGFSPTAVNSTGVSGVGDLLAALLRPWDAYFPDSLAQDLDGDGLSAGWERYFGSSDNDPDSNDDGIWDGASALAGLNPAQTDHDGDGLSTGQEIALGTSALAADSDGDDVNDDVDPYPLDPFLWSLAGSTMDMSAPEITLTKPAEAVAVP